MATPIWNETERRWTIRVQRDGVVKKFTSVKPGKAGSMTVKRKARAFENGGLSDMNVTVSAEWLKYLDDVRMRSGRENFRNTESIGRLYILPRFGKFRLSNMRPTTWQDIINSASGQQGRQLARKSLSNIRGVIISFCKFAQSDGILEAIPSLYIPKAAPTIGKDILQPEQVKRLFSDFDDEWYVDLWRFLLATGLRPGEALGLKISDYKGGTISIRRSVNAAGRITEGKNINARRGIVLHEIARDILDRQIKKTKHLHSEWIFPNRSGSMPLQSVAYKGWRRIAEQLDTNASPYGLRHTFISMIKNDLPEQMVKAIVGHSAAMDTFGVYGHAVDGEMQEAAKILDITFARKFS